MSPISDLLIAFHTTKRKLSCQIDANEEFHSGYTKMPCSTVESFNGFLKTRTLSTHICFTTTSDEDSSTRFMKGFYPYKGDSKAFQSTWIIQYTRVQPTESAPESDDRSESKLLEDSRS